MTEIIKPGSSLEIFARITHSLQEGKIIGLPTETVYGLAGDATNEHAIATIFALKNRPSFNPLICHFCSVQHVLEHCEMHPDLMALSQTFWPGPLTLVLKRKKTSPIVPLVSAGLDTLAVRIPDHPVAQEIIERYGHPLAAPSANPSEAISPTSPQHIYKAFGENPALPFIVDGGSCQVGLESTIVDLTQERPVLLRPGQITCEDLKKIIADTCTTGDVENARIRAPGMMKRHYAPGIPLRMGATSVQPDEALLAFGQKDIPEGARCTLNLSPAGNLVEAATNLFKMLHALDEPYYHAIAVMPIPQEGIGIAINDRLRRAATPCPAIKGA